MVRHTFTRDIPGVTTGVQHTTRLDLTLDLQRKYNRLMKIDTNPTHYTYAQLAAADIRCQEIENSLSLEAWDELFDGIDEIKLALYCGWFTPIPAGRFS